MNEAELNRFREILDLRDNCEYLAIYTERSDSDFDLLAVLCVDVIGDVNVEQIVRKLDEQDGPLFYLWCGDPEAPSVYSSYATAQIGHPLEHYQPLL